MAVESESVQQLMEWLAQGSSVRSTLATAETLVQKLAAVVFQGDAQWPDRPEQADAYRDALSGWFAADGVHEPQFVDLVKPDADPGAFVDWFLAVVAGWEGLAARHQSAAAQDGGSGAGLPNPHYDGTPGTRFYRFDQAAQEYQYADGADGGDWATYERRRYGEPAKDETYGLTYRYDRRDAAYAWYDEAGRTWRDQAWADRHAAGGHRTSSEKSATGSPAGPAPAWDEGWRMFYRVDAGGGYQFADAATPGEQSSGCGTTWLSRQQVLARPARRQPATGPHTAAVDPAQPPHVQTTARHPAHKAASHDVDKTARPPVHQAPAPWADTGHADRQEAGSSKGHEGAELSGPAWAARFPPGDNDTGSLAGHFGTSVANFKTAMENAGITVHVLSTRRPPQRAYLMHYSFMIANHQISADKVPAFGEPGQSPVDILWRHTDAGGAFDSAASVKAAKALAEAMDLDLGNGVKPALHSMHTVGEAVDMTTTWTKPSVTVLKADGTPVVINTAGNGMNSQLWAVGASYGVVHFATQSGAAKAPGDDKNHWSSNGH